ncbi:sugar phosphate isomerase [Actinoplanes sp. ATCC 53533]|uniref:EboA domain-containing protein n=1 Tax=Actinoplanes sp. ATCC 53533 TaxID=1288362 RepID=UPI000F7AA328|nr:EboA domain-containing protein [Actinoplanes sp. ATCC 53533]RSM73206.1 sugar phosphate isomerase [Actinoplanes sp. ATCC 53533]
MTLDDLRAALTAVPGRPWLDDALARIRTDPDAAGPLFARAERKLGREPLADGSAWTAGRAGRALLLAQLADPERIVTLYHQGDAAERLAVLAALPLLEIGDAGVPLLHDALRTNDVRLVGAALGPYAAHLDAATWRQGVVKCVFMGIALSAVDRLDDRADQELAAMLGALATERAAAGRRMPVDALALLNRLTVANTSRRQA